MLTFMYLIYLKTYEIMLTFISSSLSIQTIMRRTKSVSSPENLQDMLFQKWETFWNWWHMPWGIDDFLYQFLLYVLVLLNVQFTKEDSIIGSIQ